MAPNRLILAATSIALPALPAQEAEVLAGDDVLLAGDSVAVGTQGQAAIGARG